jgi:hypothetical protein
MFKAGGCDAGRRGGGGGGVCLETCTDVGVGLRVL